MKIFLLFFFVSIISIGLRAQNTLVVSDTKTTHLVCPGKVIYLQTGDYNLVQAETVPELSNVVRIRAQKLFVQATSLTVVCDDRIYSFDLKYGDPNQTIYPISQFQSQNAMTFSGKLMPDYEVKDLCDKVLNRHRKDYRKRKAEKDGIRMRLNSISLKEDALFFELEITNKTNMSYDVESYNFWITDKRQNKATNVQEYQIQPDYQHHHISRIPGKTTLRDVFVFEKMTIPDQRILKIELGEKALGNTGRKLCLEFKNKDIIKAKKLK